MAIKRATYQYDNGIEFDEIMFKTTADQVVEDNSRRFVSDDEKTKWNGKADLELLETVDNDLQETKNEIKVSLSKKTNFLVDNTSNIDIPNVDEKLEEVNKKYTEINNKFTEISITLDDTIDYVIDSTTNAEIPNVDEKLEEINNQYKEINSQLDNIANGSVITNKHDKPLLAIIFDDGVRNVFSNGREWFKANNVNIGLAIHNNTFQKKQIPSQLEIEEISILLNDGHEILSHGYKDEYLNTELPWAEWLIKGSADMYRDYGINCRGYVPAGGIILDKYVPLVRKNFDYAFCNYSNEEVDYKKDKYHINRVQIDSIPYSAIEPILINVASKKGILFLFSHDLKTSSNECDNINSISAIINKARELGYDVDTPNNCLIKAGVIDSYDRKNKNYRYNLLNDKTFDSWNFLNHTDVSPSNIIKDYKSNPLKNIRCGINNSKVGEYITLLGELDIELSDVNMFGEFSFKLRNELGKRGNKISVSLMGYNGGTFVKYLTYHDFVIGTDGEEYDNSVKFGVDKESLVNKIKINITLISEYEGSFICRLSEPYLSLYQY